MTTKIVVRATVKVPAPANFLIPTETGLPSFDVGELSDDDLQRVADEVRAEFVANALKRRPFGP